MKIQICEVLRFLEKQELKYEFEGNEEDYLEGFSTIYEYKKGTITWIKNGEKYKEYVGIVENIRLLVIGEDILSDIKPENAIITENPKFAFFVILKEFFTHKEKAMLGCNCCIADTAEIKENVSLGNNCVIEENVVIGENTIIGNNVVIKHGTKIGSDCVIQSGAVIGEDGFGFMKNGNKSIRVPHLGNVVIGNRVEIGTNSIIDRGTMGDTAIGDDSKINNMCHIGHNVVIGKSTFIMVGSIICGSTVVHDYAYVAPRSVIRNQLDIGENSLVGMGSVVVSDVEPNKVYMGVPAKFVRDNSNKII